MRIEWNWNVKEFNTIYQNVFFFFQETNEEDYVLKEPVKAQKKLHQVLAPVKKGVLTLNHLHKLPTCVVVLDQHNKGVFALPWFFNFSWSIFLILNHFTGMTIFGNHELSTLMADAIEQKALQRTGTLGPIGIMTGPGQVVDMRLSSTYCTKVTGSYLNLLKNVGKIYSLGKLMLLLLLIVQSLARFSTVPLKSSRDGTKRAQPIILRRQKASFLAQKVSLHIYVQRWNEGGR